MLDEVRRALGFINPVVDSEYENDNILDPERSFIPL